MSAAKKMSFSFKIFKITTLKDSQTTKIFDQLQDYSQTNMVLLFYFLFITQEAVTKSYSLMQQQLTIQFKYQNFLTMDKKKHTSQCRIFIYPSAFISYLSLVTMCRNFIGELTKHFKLYVARSNNSNRFCWKVQIAFQTRI